MVGAEQPEISDYLVLFLGITATFLVAFFTKKCPGGYLRKCFMPGGAAYCRRQPLLGKAYLEQGLHNGVVKRPGYTWLARSSKRSRGKPSPGPLRAGWVGCPVGG